MNHLKRSLLGILSVPLASALLLAMPGCVSEPAPAPPPPNVPPPDDTPPSNDPRTYFIQDVYPQMSVCADCHVAGQFGPPFLGTSAETAYTAIKGSPSLYQPAVDSLLLKKGEHQGPSLTPAQSTVITHWLDLEFPPGNDTPSAPPPVSQVDQLLEEFANCMDIGEWQQSGMSEFPLTQTLDSGPCAGCHFDGLGGTFLNSDFNVTFEANKLQPYILKLVEPEYDGSGRLLGLKQSRRLLDKGDGICPDIDLDDFDTCHPEFDFSINQLNEGRLSNFVGSTLSKVARGGCGP